MDWLSQNWIWIVLAVFVVLMMTRRGGMMGCGTGHAHDDRETRMPPAGGNVDRATTLDPVNGKPVDKQHAATSFYRGRVYYFESAESRKRFEESPERYASDSAAAETSSGAAKHHPGC